MEKYIAHKRFKGSGIYGFVNIPATTEGFCLDGIIFMDNKAICCENSENAHQYFAVNNDDKGLERGILTGKIQRLLSNNKKLWEKIWCDKICQKYKRCDYDDYWLWNNDFFTAPIKDLQYIYNLIKGE